MMDDTTGEELDNKANSCLIEWVEQYCSSDSTSGSCEPRNRILVAVVNGQGKDFIQIIIESFDKEEDLVCKRNICRLLYDVLSRTEDLFSPEYIVPLLTKCLPITICAQFAIIGLRSLLQRHVKLNGISPESLTIIKGIYDVLLSYDVASMPQQPRIDFLWISHFMVDAFRNTNMPPVENMVTRFCECVTGEKDPRNLLVLFELIVKLCGNPLNDDDIKALASIYTTYYPIQFSPPKNDKIGIKPLDLKERLLRTFKACSKFGPYSMEVMMDCLYSGYGSSDEHTEVLCDTLELFRECAQVYGEKCYTEHVEAFIEVIISEFFMASTTDTEDPIRNIINDVVDLNIGPVSEDLDCQDYSIIEANKLGELYYEGWESVSKHLRLYGDIMEVYMGTIDLESKIKPVTDFVKLLRNQITVDNTKNSDANGHAGYFLDVLCGLERYHELILEHLMVPLCNEITSKFAEFKRGQLSEPVLCCQISLMLPVLTNTLFAKMVSKCQQPIPTKFATSIIVAALCCIQLNENKVFTRGLKLLTLAIVSSKTCMLEHVLSYCLKDSQLISKSASTRSGKDVSLYADAVLAIMKCHFVHCNLLVDRVREMAMAVVDTNDIERDISAYVTSEIDLSREIAEIIATTLDKTTDNALVESLCGMCFRLFVYVCENPKSEIISTAYLFSHAITANREKVRRVIKNKVLFKTVFGYYKTLWELGKVEDLSPSVLKFATYLVPIYMSMVMDCPTVDIAKEFCRDGYAFLLPIILKDIDNDVVSIAIEYAKVCNGMMELEAIAWLLQRWVSQYPINDTQIADYGQLKHLMPADVAVNDGIYGCSDTSTGGTCRMDILLYAGVPPMLLSYVIQSMEHEGIKRFCTETYLKSVPSSLITNLIAHLFPFQPERLSLGLKYLGFDLKGMTESRQKYTDIFMLDGTEICQMTPIERMQYQFLVNHCQVKEHRDTNIAKHLIKLLYGMDDHLPNIVALQALVLSLEDYEIAIDYASVTELLVHQFMKKWNSVNASTILRKENYIADGSNNVHDCDVSPYYKWLQHEFLFQSLSILVRLMSYLQRTRLSECGHSYDFDYHGNSVQNNIPIPEKRTTFNLESDQWEQLADVAVSVALGCSLPICRILSTLVVHCMVKAVPYVLSMEHTKMVIKRMTGCLGDGDQRVRTVALTCRHMWLRK